MTPYDPISTDPNQDWLQVWAITLICFILLAFVILWNPEDEDEEDERYEAPTHDTTHTEVLK